jgi:hypothetical protein
VSSAAVRVEVCHVGFLCDDHGRGPAWVGSHVGLRWSPAPAVVADDRKGATNALKDSCRIPAARGISGWRTWSRELARRIVHAVFACATAARAMFAAAAVPATTGVVIISPFRSAGGATFPGGHAVGSINESPGSPAQRRSTHIAPHRPQLMVPELHSKRPIKIRRCRPSGHGFCEIPSLTPPRRRRPRGSDHCFANRAATAVRGWARFGNYRTAHASNFCG